MGCLQDAKYSSKKKSFYSSEQKSLRIQGKRELFLECLSKIDPSKIIVLDEAGANLGMATDYSRALGGKRAHRPKPFVVGKKYSMIGAISRVGIVAMMYIELAVNQDIFASFIEKLLLKHLKRGYYLVLDNVRFHKTKEIVSLIESKGAKAVFLPAYSPDLSPIEKMWSKIKTILKRLMPRSEAEFYNALAEAISEVDQIDCEEWFVSCGY